MLQKGSDDGDGSVLKGRVKRSEHAKCCTGEKCRNEACGFQHSAGIAVPPMCNLQHCFIAAPSLHGLCRVDVGHWHGLARLQEGKGLLVQNPGMFAPWQCCPSKSCWTMQLNRHGTLCSRHLCNTVPTHSHRPWSPNFRTFLALPQRLLRVCPELSNLLYYTIKLALLYSLYLC